LIESVPNFHFFIHTKIYNKEILNFLKIFLKSDIIHLTLQKPSICQTVTKYINQEKGTLNSTKLLVAFILQFSPKGIVKFSIFLLIFIPWTVILIISFPFILKSKYKRKKGLKPNILWEPVPIISIKYCSEAVKLFGYKVPLWSIIYTIFAKKGILTTLYPSSIILK